MGWQHLTSENVPEFKRRVALIRSDSKRRFGIMSAPGMLAHLTRAIEVSLGEIEVSDASNFFSRNVIRRIAFETPLPWPKGKIKAPDNFFRNDASDVDAERERLLVAIERFVKVAESEPQRRALHPTFGSLTLKYWQRLHGKHFNHHFEQFGA